MCGTSPFDSIWDFRNILSVHDQGTYSDRGGSCYISADISFVLWAMLEPLHSLCTSQYHVMRRVISYVCRFFMSKHVRFLIFFPVTLIWVRPRWDHLFHISSPFRGLFHSFQLEIRASDSAIILSWISYFCDFCWNFQREFSCWWICRDYFPVGSSTPASTRPQVRRWVYGR